MSNITFKIEKDVRWNVDKRESEVRYFVWAGNSIIALSKTEQEAIEAYEQAKVNYKPNRNEIIREETVEIPIAS
jgi:hypothetical protein